MKHLFISYYATLKQGGHTFGETVYSGDVLFNRDEFVHQLHKEQEFIYRDIILMNIVELSEEDFRAFTRGDV